MSEHPETIEFFVTQMAALRSYGASWEMTSGLVPIGRFCDKLV